MARQYVIRLTPAEFVAFSQMAARAPLTLVLQSGICTYRVELPHGDMKEADAMAKELVG